MLSEDTYFESTLNVQVELGKCACWVRTLT